MARPLRLLISSGVYHVVARGNARQPVFADDADRLRFFETLDTALGTYDARCHSYCLMSNHYHLLLETGRPNLSGVMRQLNGVYGQRFNRRHGRCGHVFQGRYSATLVDRNSYLLEVCRYIVLNPVRAGLVEHPADWDWSSYRPYVGTQSPPTFLCTAWVLAALDPRGGDEAHRSFAQFVDEGSPEPERAAQVHGAPSVLGDAGFLRDVDRLAAPAAGVASIPKSQRFVARPTLRVLFDECAGREERNRRIQLAHVRHGYSQREIALHLALHVSTVSLAVRGVEPIGRATPTTLESKA